MDVFRKTESEPYNLTNIAIGEEVRHSIRGTVVRIYNGENSDPLETNRRLWRIFYHQENEGKLPDDLNKRFYENRCFAWRIGEMDLKFGYEKVLKNMDPDNSIFFFENYLLKTFFENITGKDAECLENVLEWEIGDSEENKTESEEHRKLLKAASIVSHATSEILATMPPLIQEKTV